MNLVDSSAWLEFFSGSKNASRFEPIILSSEDLLVPTICLFEVFKIVARDFSENEAIKAVAFMKAGKVVEISERIALVGAQLSLSLRLPMADSLILAVARQYEAVLWTQDADFKGMDNVRYFAKKK